MSLPACLGEVAMLQETIARLATIHPSTREHYCPEWDGLKINEYDPEFNACVCEFHERPNYCSEC